MILRPLAVLWRRGVRFDRKERRRLLQAVLRYLNAGIPIGRTLAMLARDASHPVSRKLCSHCIAQQPTTGLYMPGLGDDGYFTEVEAAMLAIGEENERLTDILNILVDETRARLNMWHKVIEPSRNPIMAALISLLILGGMATQRELLLALASEAPAWVGYGEALVANWHLALGVPLALWAAVAWMGRSLPEPYRLLAAKYGMFRISDRLFGAECLRLGKVLIGLGASPAAVIDVWRQAFRQNPWHSLMTHRVSHLVEEGYDLVASMEHHMLRSEEAAAVREGAPTMDPQVLSKGFEVGIIKIEEDLEDIYGNVALAVQVVCWVVAVWVIYQVFPFIMGIGVVG